jgi:transposase
MMLATIDYYSARIEELTVKIRALCRPYERQIAQPDAVPGTGEITAQDVIAEIGVDMTVFPTAAHLVPWARWCPQVAPVRRQAHRRRRLRTRQPLHRGGPRRSHHQRRPHPDLPRREIPPPGQAHAQEEALVATGNSLLTIYHALLSDPEATYTELGTDYYQRRAGIRRQARNHLRGLERLGYKVTIEPIDPATGELKTAAR